MIRQLPDDADLVKMFHLGRTNREIAEAYGVTVQAVDQRYAAMGLQRRPIVNQVAHLLAPLQIISHNTGESHHNEWSMRLLRVYLRRQLGDRTLTEKQLNQARVFEEKIRDKGLILCYYRERHRGWVYEPRAASDGAMVVRWPEDAPRPEGNALRVLSLPCEPALAT